MLILLRDVPEASTRYKRIRKSGNLAVAISVWLPAAPGYILEPPRHARIELSALDLYHCCQSC